MVKIYHKVIDRRGSKSEVILGPEEQSVRFEITLRQSTLNKMSIRTIDELYQMQFRKVLRLVHFRLPTVRWGSDGESIMSKVSKRRNEFAEDAFVGAGMTGFDRFTRTDAPRAKYGCTVACTKWNDRFGKALDRLSKKLSKEWSCSYSTDFRS